MPLKEEIWGGPVAEEIFRRFQEARDPVVRSTQLLLEQFYREHFAGNETVLEIGAGMGFLRRQWPQDYKGEWIQLDQQRELLEKAEGQRLCGSAYDIPLPDRSIDVVCGLGSFDVLFDLERAVAEARRVLKDSGFFFHLLDLKPNPEAIMYDLEQKGKTYIPEDLGLIFYVPDEHREAYQNEMDSLDDRIRNGESITRWQIQKKYGYFLDQLAYFNERLTTALASYFQHVESGTLHSHFTGKKLPHHDGKWRKIYANLSGELRQAFFGTEYAHLPRETDIPKGHCMEISEMCYVVAKNPIV